MRTINSKRNMIQANYPTYKGAASKLFFCNPKSWDSMISILNRRKTDGKN